MKPTLLVAAGLPLVLGLALSACQSPPPPPPSVDYFQEVAGDLDAIQTELKDGVFQVDSVTEALAALQSAAETDLRGAFEGLTESIASLEAVRGRLRDLGESVRKKEEAFQQAWTEAVDSVQDVNLRHTAERGRADVEEGFAKLEQAAADLRGLYDAWEGKVKGLATMLEAELSTASVESLTSQITAVLDDAAPLKASMRTIIQDMGAVIDSLESALS